MELLHQKIRSALKSANARIPSVLNRFHLRCNEVRDRRQLDSAKLAPPQHPFFSISISNSPTVKKICETNSPTLSNARTSRRYHRAKLFFFFFLSFFNPSRSLRLRSDLSSSDSINHATPFPSTLPSRSLQYPFSPFSFPQSFLVTFFSPSFIFFRPFSFFVDFFHPIFLLLFLQNQTFSIRFFIFGFVGNFFI